MRKLFICLLFFISSCTNSETHHAKAEEYYKHAFWLNEYVYKTASDFFAKQAAPAIADKNHCAHSIALEITEKMQHIGKMMPEMDKQVVALLEKNYSDDELDQINRFYISTTIGRYLSSIDGYKELSELMKNSKYKNKFNLANKDNQAQTVDNSIQQVLELLPPKDREEYNAFHDFAVGKKFFAPNPKLEKGIYDAMKPFLDQSANLAIYALKVKELCAKKNDYNLKYVTH